MPEQALAALPISRSYLAAEGRTIPLMSCTLPEISWAVRALPTGATTPSGSTQLGELSLGDLIVSFAPDFSPHLPAWVRELMSGGHTLHDLRVIRTDMTGKVQEGFQLSNCVLTELHFPACAATALNAYLVEAVFRPESIVGLAPASLQPLPPASKQRPWLSSDFALSVEGLPSRSIVQVDGISLKRSIASRPVGELRNPLPYYGVGHSSPLVLTLAGSDYAAWRDFALQQIKNGTPPSDIAATLELRDATLAKTLASFKLILAGLNSFRFTLHTAAVDGRAAQRAVASLPIVAIDLDMTPARMD